jgi:DNA-directed RNA polymerase subunit RPC12/RpoP
MKFTCTKCNKSFEISNEAKTIKCPACRTKFYSTLDSSDLIRVKDQLIRRNPKVHMSKKLRLKERREKIM